MHLRKVKLTQYAIVGVYPVSVLVNFSVQNNLNSMWRQHLGQHKLILGSRRLRKHLDKNMEQCNSWRVSQGESIHYDQGITESGYAFIQSDQGLPISTVYSLKHVLTELSHDGELRMWNILKKIYSVRNKICLWQWLGNI